MIFVAFYIDDLLIFTNDAKRKLFLKSQLHERFKKTDLGEAKFLCGPLFNIILYG